MSADLVVKMDDQEWRFSGDDLERIKSCSKLVKEIVEEAQELEPDREEDIELLIDSQKFKPAQIQESLEYLKSHNYNPPEYGKVISNQLEKNIEDEAGRLLVSKYDRITVSELLGCADYLQISSIEKLCLFRVAVEVFIDTNQPGAVNSMMEKFDIKSTYSVQTEIDLKKNYTFLNPKQAV